MRHLHPRTTCTHAPPAPTHHMHHAPRTHASHGPYALMCPCRTSSYIFARCGGTAPLPPCCFPLLPLPCSLHSADIRLEEQLAKATLGINHAQGFRARCQNAAAPCCPPSEPWGPNRHRASRPVRRGRHSPQPATAPRPNSPPRDTKRRCTTKSAFLFGESSPLLLTVWFRDSLDASQDS
jgi:hypothetical protein